MSRIVDFIILMDHNSNNIPPSQDYEYQRIKEVIGRLGFVCRLSLTKNNVLKSGEIHKVEGKKGLVDGGWG